MLAEVVATKGIKFSIPDGGAEAPFDYGNVYWREETTGGERLLIGPSANQVEMLLTLAATWPNYQFGILYVLLVSHTGAELGRYQSPWIESYDELREFMEGFAEFFENDGRHHVWIGSATGDGTLVYDQHDLIFAYGDLDRYEQVLHAQGFVRRKFWFPAPHIHQFLSENVGEEERLLKYFEWQVTPLRPEDEWD